jgi:hypothetical protein
MKIAYVATASVSLALLGVAATWAFAQPVGKPSIKTPQRAGEEADEQVIELSAAPAAVRAAAAKLAGSEKAISKVTKEEDEGVYTYEVEYAADGLDQSATLTAAGDVMELEKAVAEASLPAAALAALKKDYPNATFKSPKLVQKFYFETDVTEGGKTHEVKVDAAGEIKDKSKRHDEENEAQKGHKSDSHEDNDND